jgi:hypothetical protein
MTIHREARFEPKFAPADWGTNATAVGEDAELRLCPEWQHLLEQIAAADLDDRSLWGEPILDPAEYLRRALAAES